MTKDKNKKFGKEQQLLEAARLGNYSLLVSSLGQFRQTKQKKKSNPLASLRKSCGINSVRDPVTGFTCLHHAALNGYSQCVRLLLDCGAKLNALDYKGSSALHLAAWAGNLDVVRTLISHRSTLHVTCDDSTSAAANETAYLQDIVDLNLQNNDNQTPLLLAAQFGHKEVVCELLAQSSINVHLRNIQLESALDLACLNGRLETVELLLDSSPQLVAELRQAYAIVSLPSERLLQAARGQPNGVESCQSPSQRRSIASGWTMSLLRSKSRDSPPNAQNNDESTAQRFQATLLDQERRRKSLAAGRLAPDAWAKEVGRTGNEDCLLDHSPLHYAVRRGHLQVVNLLLNKYAANILQLTSLGSVLHEIAMHHHKLNYSTQAPGNGNGDMISLLFGHLSRQTTSFSLEERKEVVQRLLSLRNSQHKSVFDVLHEINNRSANEIKRLLMELSERVFQLAQSDSYSQGKSRNENNFQFGAGQVARLQDSNNNINRAQESMFGDSTQISSFVTMKRAPKQPLADSTNQQSRNASQQVDCMRRDTSIPLYTRTIDRRCGSSKQQLSNSVSVDQNCWPSSRAQQFPSGQQGATSSICSANESLFSPITRSVSNLTAEQCQKQHKQLVASLGAGSDCRADKLSDELLGRGGWSSREHVYDNNLDSDGRSRTLVRSQTNCSHLMGRSVFGGDQQQVGAPEQGQFGVEKPTACDNLQRNSTLDRRTINRRYHVYDHEFYPPRLLNQTLDSKQQQQHARQATAVAVVPPLGRSESTGANSTWAAAPFARRGNTQQQPQVAQPAIAPFAGQQQRLHGRLSLNMDTQRQFEEELNQQRAHQQQMDRFLARLARKSIAEQPTSVTAAANDELYLAHLQQYSMQQLHGSSSLESRLGANAAGGKAPDGAAVCSSFETTRQALVRDFDRMIGRELLNRDHLSMTGSASSDRLSNSSSSQRSILTGVSLDMDTRGENLTVSGTRVTLPASLPAPPLPPPQELVAQHLPRTDRIGAASPTNGNKRISQNEQRQAGKLPSIDGQLDQVSSAPTGMSTQTIAQVKVSSHATQTSPPAQLQAEPLQLASRAASPQKPPRPSLRSQQLYRSQLSLNEQLIAAAAADSSSTPSPSSSRSAIYDLPNVGTNAASSSSFRPLPPPTAAAATGDHQQRYTRPSSRTSLHAAMLGTGQVPLATPTSVAANKPQLGKRPQQQSITKPPSEKPPPLPLAASCETLLSSPPANAPANAETDASGLLKMGSISSTSSSVGGSSTISSAQFTSSQCTRQSSRLSARSSRATLTAQEARTGAAAFQLADLDSGVCTSNSPASTGQEDSDGAPPAQQTATQLTGNKHMLSLVIDSNGANASCGERQASPPSPKTAQCFIEQAFVPLNETGQTRDSRQQFDSSSNRQSDLSRFGCDDQDDGAGDEATRHLRRRHHSNFFFGQGYDRDPVDMVVGWLGSTATDCRVAAPTREVAGNEYENCEALQQQLRGARCKSLSNLLGTLSSSCVAAFPEEAQETNCAKSAQTVSDWGDGNDEGDYAATSDETSTSSVQVLNLDSDEVSRVDAAKKRVHSCSPSSAKQFKEVMLKIVLDESERHPNGDEVFYINPSEFKKISSQSEGVRQQNEAETLTDEELCATVDKSSGLIRFTLRKRRPTAADRVHPNEGEAAAVQLTRGQSEAAEAQSTSTAADNDSLVSKTRQEERKEEEEEESAALADATAAPDNKRSKLIADYATCAGEASRPPQLVASSKQTSTESNESSETSTSSTSGESIKSFVAAAKPVAGQRPLAPAAAAAEQQQAEAESCSRERAPEERAPQSNAASVVDIAPSASNELVRVEQKFARSIVSETARRLEEAAKARGATLPKAQQQPPRPPPVAAARKLTQVRPEVERPPTTNGAIELQPATAAGRPQAQLGERPGTDSLARPAKRSVCWPPSKTANNRQVSEEFEAKRLADEEASSIVGKVSANRLSFQRLIEQRSGAGGIHHTATLTRPKPPPPAKPANLIVGRQH